MCDKVSPQELKARLNADGELALLDLREAGTFQQAHLFDARSIPLSRLELLILDAVPRKATPIVLVDGADDGPAARGAPEPTVVGSRLMGRSIVEIQIVVKR